MIFKLIMTILRIDCHFVLLYNFLFLCHCSICSSFYCLLSDKYKISKYFAQRIKSSFCICVSIKKIYKNQINMVLNQFHPFKPSKVSTLQHNTMEKLFFKSAFLKYIKSELFTLFIMSGLKKETSWGLTWETWKSKALRANSMEIFIPGKSVQKKHQNNGVTRLWWLMLWCFKSCKLYSTSTSVR